MSNGYKTTKKLCAFSGLDQFENLPSQIKSDLETMCRPQSYKSGEVIAEISTHPPFIGVVSEGILRMQKSLPDGRQHVVGLLVAGDMFGRVFNGNMHFSVEAATDATVFQFQRGPMEDILMSSPELDRLILLNLTSELDRARDWMIILANPKVRSRLTGFILLLCTKFQAITDLVSLHGTDVHVRIPISRTDLAHLLGTRVESISRGLHALADDGLIEILRPDLVAIRCFEALTDEIGDPDLLEQVSLKNIVRDIQKNLQ
ncbi:Crp/Fnr family transcriptional regulator [Roseicyclus marinus]|uniref:Crp/Fnr family transcriptional regulator n=1 Tax=Roseicyclus marinus TaxID=2161673 RepID=UPI0030C7830A